MVNTKEIKSFYPDTLEEAIACMKRKTAIIAGATQFMLHFEPHKRVLPFRQLIFLDHIAELKEIIELPHVIRLGAMCTAAQLASAGRMPQVLCQAAAVVGSPALRERATVGGNILTASPTGDMLTALYALDAKVRLRCGQGERMMGLRQFVLGPGKTAIREEEILTSIEFTYNDFVREQSSYQKVAAKRTNGITKVSLAAVLPERDYAGPEARIRLAYGAVGTTVRRAFRLEQVLEEKFCMSAYVTQAEVEHLLAEDFTPINDFRSTAAYRRQVAINLTMQVLKESCRIL